MSTIGLTPSAASGLDPAVVLLRDTQGFLYLPVFVESVLAASACLNYLQTHLSQQFYNLAWPIDELKTTLIGNLDDAINKLPRNSTIVLDASSKERHKLALEAAAYLNLRREPLRAAALSFIICWPIELKDELLAKAPDLWSMRALSPWVTNAELVFAESSSQNEAVFEDALSATKTTGKPSASVDKKLAKWERHHDLKLADLSELDALKLANDLIDVRQYSVAVEIVEAVVHALQKQEPTVTTANSSKARAFNLLAIAYHRLGNIQAALLAAQEAVAIYRRLAAANPAVFEHELAGSVNNLANALSATGERAGALLAAKESVAIRRRLAAANPAVFEHELAGSVSNLANRLSETGDRAGALQAAKEAVAIRRRLAAANAAAFEPALAMSLNNLALRLSETNELEGALLAAQEALMLFENANKLHVGLFENEISRAQQLIAHLEDSKST